jgi:flagellar basal-body rod protein FlgB
VLDDITSVTAHTALDGLAMRQRVTADNIANIETPGFLAGRVSFEDNLRKAVSDNAPADTKFLNRRSLEPTRLNGNNVNLDHETLTHIDTNMRYQLMLRVLDGKISTLRTAMGTGA